MQSSQNLTAFFSPPEVKVAKELVRSVEEEDDKASVEFLCTEYPLGEDLNTVAIASVWYVMRELAAAQTGMRTAAHLNRVMKYWCRQMGIEL